MCTSDVVGVSEFFAPVTLTVGFCCSYRQYFDLEGESGIVVRAIGTAVKLARLSHQQPMTPPVSPGLECVLHLFRFLLENPCQTLQKCDMFDAFKMISFKSHNLFDALRGFAK